MALPYGIKRYTDITIQSTKRGSVKHTMTIVEQIFDPCSGDDHHDSCHNTTFCTPSMLAMCACPCHQE